MTDPYHTQPQPGRATSDVDPPPRQRKKVWPLWLGVGLVFVLGIGGFVATILSGVMSFAQGIERFEAPGTLRTALKPGTYTVYHEHQSQFGGRFYSQRSGGVTIRNFRVIPEGGGAPLPVRGSGMNASYSLGSRAGTSVLEFDVPAAGGYVVTSDVDPPAVLGVGPGGPGGLIATIFGSLGICFGSGGLFIVLLVLAIVRTVHNQRAAPQSACPPAGR